MKAVSVCVKGGRVAGIDLESDTRRAEDTSWLVLMTATGRSAKLLVERLEGTAVPGGCCPLQGRSPREGRLIDA